MDELRAQKPWTTSEVKRAAELWKLGHKRAAIADALNRTDASVRVKIAENRDLFPRRKREKGETDRLGRPISIHVRVTKFMNRKLHEAAKSEGKSINQLVGEVLRDAVLRGKRASSATTRPRASSY